MTAQQLPERPNLEQLKQQAKDLLRSARANEPPALARFRILPAFARASDDAIREASPALHDAQSVIAREHGFLSWNALRERVEELTLAFGAAVDQFIEAATDGRVDRAERLLALHPGIATANLHTALILGDAATVEARLTADPALVRQAGGPRGWEPLLYACHASLRRGSPGRAESLAAIARRLLALGADPNARFPWLHHGVRRPVLWGAVCVTRALPLAEALLDAGADPNDGVTLPLAASGGDLPILDLLLAHGADVNHPWATDGATPLYAALTWGPAPAGARWLLEHGADPDAVFAPNGETPLHAAARTGDVALVELMVARGADVTRPNGDGRTPYAVAELAGHRAVAEWLLAHGAPHEMCDVDRLVAACSRGDGAAARAMLAARPSLPSELTEGHYAALHQAAERGDVPALEAMLACGFDPNRPDSSIGRTALHSAAMAGRPEAVRVLLAHGASVDARDNEFHAPPVVWAAEGARSQGGPGQDHAAVGRLLIDAGSPVEWQAGAEPSESILEVLAEWRRPAAGRDG